MPRKIKICIEEGCHNEQTSKNYCRLHYMMHWKEKRREKSKKAAKKLDRYVEGIMKRGGTHYGEAANDRNNAESDVSGSDEVESLIEDLGYSDPESLDEIISHIKIERD